MPRLVGSTRRSSLGPGPSMALLGGRRVPLSFFWVHPVGLRMWALDLYRSMRSFVHLYCFFVDGCFEVVLWFMAFSMNRPHPDLAQKLRLWVWPI